MNLFVEREFIVNFEIEYDFKNYYSNSAVKNIFHRILSEYSFVTLYTDYENDVEALKESLLINLYTNTNASVHYIKNFSDFFEGIDELPIRTLVFTENKKEVFNRISSLGGIHFSYDDFEIELGQFLQRTERKIDFSDISNFTWDEFSEVSKIPFRSIVISDPYILTDKSDQRLERNLIPMLKELMDTKEHKIELCIYSDEIQNSRERGRSEIEVLDKKRSFVSSKLAGKLENFSIVKSKVYRNHFEQHDRYCYMDFVIISAGKGFNVVPFKVGDTSIDIKTIFDKSSHRQLINHLKKLQVYNQKVYNRQVLDTMLNYYPDKPIQNRLLNKLHDS